MVNILEDDEGEQFLSSPSFFMSTGELASFYETGDFRRSYKKLGSILRSPVGVEPLASSSIAINNNLSVSFAAIAGGISTGLYTIFIMASNGLSIGAVATLVSKNNLAYPFWAFVFPHGSLELPAIFLAGGAGLLIGKAIIFPGKYRRIDALKSNSTKAAQLLFGIIPMLIIAGTIEGFFSPNPVIPSPIKYLTGTSLFLLLALYCCRHKKSEVRKPSRHGLLNERSLL